jgi:hypothetical protein
MTTQTNTQELPNGPAAAAFLAGGIGCATLALMTILVEASAVIKTALTWSTPVGPLSGKVGMAVITFFVSWVIAHLLFRGKNVNFARISTIALILLAFGLLGTFPPFFLLFAAE